MVSQTKRVLLIFALWGGWSLPQTGHSAQLPSQDVEFFDKKIRPVLVDQCYLCHSSASPQVQGGLLLDSRDGLLKGGKSGPALVPEEPEQSLLIKALRYTEEGLKMPPSGRLPAETIADFELWVEKGATDPRQPTAVASVSEKPAYDFAEEHKFWAYQLPHWQSLPKTKTRDWSRNWIDTFILAKLEEKGLKPGSPADKRTLIRRATFDLIGLPPTPQ